MQPYLTERANTIIQHVATVFGVDLTVYRVKAKSKQCAYPRFIAAVLLWQHMENITLKDIAMLCYGKRDHTFTIHAINRYRELMKTGEDEEFIAAYETCKIELNSIFNT